MTMSIEAETKLLAEGAQSYVGAVNAVWAFRDIVQRRCRAVVENRLGEYAKALDWKLGADALLDWETTPGEWSGDEATVGVWFKFGQVSAIYHHLWLPADEAVRPEAAMSVYLGSQKKRDRFWDALSPHDQDLIKLPSNREIYLGEKLNDQEEIGRFDEKLDGLLTRWIQLWKRASGLKRLVKQTGEGEE
jgi:hypothetical protein